MSPRAVYYLSGLLILAACDGENITTLDPNFNSKIKIEVVEVNSHTVDAQGNLPQTLYSSKVKNTYFIPAIAGECDVTIPVNLQAEIRDLNNELHATQTGLYCEEGHFNFDLQLPINLDDDDYRVYIQAESDDIETLEKGSLYFTRDVAHPEAPIINITDTGLDSGDGFTNQGKIEFSNLENDALFEIALDDPDGWKVHQEESLTLDSDGTYTIYTRQRDKAGNFSTVNSRTIVYDTTPPANPVLQLEADTGASATDMYTNNPKVLVQKLESDGLWEYVIDSGSPTVRKGSVTSIDFDSDGTHANIKARQLDKAGNLSGYSDTLTFTLDTTKPAQPGYSYTDTGANTKDAITNNPAVALTGLGDNGYSNDKGIYYTYAYNDKSINVDITGDASSFLLENGDHNVVVTQTDLAGNTSDALEFDLLVDLVKPSQPDIRIVDTGRYGYDKVTRHETITLVLDPSEDAYSYDITRDTALYISQDQQITDASVDLDLTTDASLLEGQLFNIRLVQRDKAGNESEAKTLLFRLDAQNPADPVIQLNDTGDITNDRVTYDPTIDIGNLEDNTGNFYTFTYRHESGVELSSDTDINDATHDHNLSDLSGDGYYLLKVVQTDLAGNSSADVSTDLTVDTAVPAKPTISLENDTGDSSTDRVTNDRTIQFVFNGHDDSFYKYIYDITRDGAAVATTKEVLITSDATVDIDLTDDSPAITGHAYELALFVRDLAGNESPLHTLDVTVDTQNPADPVIQLNDTGDITNDRVTYDPTIDIGNLEDNTGNFYTFTYRHESGVELSSDTDINDATHDHNLSDLSGDGYYLLKVVQTDLAGNASTEVSTDLTLDTTSPATPEVDLSQDTGRDSSDKITNNSTIKVTNLDTNESRFAYSIYDKSADSTSDHASNITNATDSFDLTRDGAFVITLAVTDLAGNLSDASVDVTLDTAIPAKPGIDLESDTGTSNSDRITNNSTIELSNLETAGLTASWYTLSINGSDATADISATDITHDLTADGAFSLIIKQTDLAGNQSLDNSMDVTLDTAAPYASLLSVGGAKRTCATGYSGSCYGANSDISMDLSLSEPVKFTAAKPVIKLGLYNGSTDQTKDATHDQAAGFVSGAISFILNSGAVYEDKDGVVLGDITGDGTAITDRAGNALKSDISNDGAFGSVFVDSLAPPALTSLALSNYRSFDTSTDPGTVQLSFTKPSVDRSADIADYRIRARSANDKSADATVDASDATSDLAVSNTLDGACTLITIGASSVDDFGNSSAEVTADDKVFFFDQPLSLSTKSASGGAEQTTFNDIEDRPRLNPAPSATVCTDLSADITYRITYTDTTGDEQVDVSGDISDYDENATTLVPFRTYTTTFTATLLDISVDTSHDWIAYTSRLPAWYKGAEFTTNVGNGLHTTTGTDASYDATLFNLDPLTNTSHSYQNTAPSLDANGALWSRALDSGDFRRYNLRFDNDNTTDFDYANKPIPNDEGYTLYFVLTPPGLGVDNSSDDATSDLTGDATNRNTQALFYLGSGGYYGADISTDAGAGFAGMLTDIVAGNNSYDRAGDATLDYNPQPLTRTGVRQILAYRLSPITGSDHKYALCRYSGLRADANNGDCTSTNQVDLSTDAAYGLDKFYLGAVPAGSASDTSAGVELLGANAGDMQLHEVMLYAEAHSDTNREKIINSLAEKWSVPLAGTGGGFTASLDYDADWLKIQQDEITIGSDSITCQDGTTDANIPVLEVSVTVSGADTEYYHVFIQQAPVGVKAGPYTYLQRNNINPSSSDDFVIKHKSGGDTNPFDIDDAHGGNEAVKWGGLCILDKQAYVLAVYATDVTTDANASTLQAFEQDHSADIKYRTTRTYFFD